MTTPSLDPEEMGEEMDDGGDEVETDGCNMEPRPLPSGSAPHSNDDSQGFVPVSSVDLKGEGSKGSGSGAGSCDPWGRISELPPRLGEKMMELKTERLVGVA